MVLGGHGADSAATEAPGWEADGMVLGISETRNLPVANAALTAQNSFGYRAVPLAFLRSDSSDLSFLEATCCTGPGVLRVRALLVRIVSTEWSVHC